MGSLLSRLGTLLLAVWLVPGGTAPVGPADSVPAAASAPPPFWVANFVPTSLWSGVDAAAISFSSLAQFTPLLVVGQEGSRLLVLNPGTEGLAYVEARAVGPVGPPWP